MPAPIILDPSLPATPGGRRRLTIAFWFMHKLNAQQQDLLVQITMHGRLPADQVDGRRLRALLSRGLVEIVGHVIIATTAGRRQASGNSRPLPQSTLNHRQEELLRRVLRQDRVPVDEVDGRVTRPLISRGLVTLHENALTSTRAGRLYFAEHALPPRRGRPRVEHARATAIRRAAGQLEAAIPSGAEVLVGNIIASADDLVDAIRRHAGKLERRRRK